MFRILVVDDDKNTRLLLKAVLQAENYTVFTAENGENAGYHDAQNGRVYLYKNPAGNQQQSAHSDDLRQTAAGG